MIIYFVLENNIYSHFPILDVGEYKSNFFLFSNFYLFIFIVLLFICAYKAWVISLSCPHPVPYHPLHALPLPPTPAIPRRNFFALISNFVEERV
jgi:hypothetical protein